MLKSHFVFTLVLGFFLAGPAAVAAPINFNFLDSTIEDIDEVASFSLTVNGISALVSTNDGVLNQTSSGFGVNATGSGDDTDALDDGAGSAESIFISFSSTINLLGITVSGFGSSDRGLLTIGMEQLSIINSGFLDTGSRTLSTGNDLRIQFLSGNGFSLDGISVSTASVSPIADVPEPTPLALLLIGSLGIIGARSKHLSKPLEAC